MERCPHCSQRTVPRVDRFVSVPVAGTPRLTYRCRACRGRIVRRPTRAWARLNLVALIVFVLLHVLLFGRDLSDYDAISGWVLAGVSCLLMPLHAQPEPEAEPPPSSEKR